MHRVPIELAYSLALLYVGLVALREISLLAADRFPSLSRAIEFAIGTGGHGAGTAH